MSSSFPVDLPTSLQPVMPVEHMTIQQQLDLAFSKPLIIPVFDKPKSVRMRYHNHIACIKDMETKIRYKLGLTILTGKNCLVIGPKDFDIILMSRLGVRDTTQEKLDTAWYELFPHSNPNAMEETEAEKEMWKDIERRIAFNEQAKNAYENYLGRKPIDDDTGKE